jgi:hypothetical protein
VDGDGQERRWPEGAAALTVLGAAELSALAARGPASILGTVIVGRRLGAALVGFSLVVTLVAWGGSDGNEGGAAVDELPFGLEQLEGTEPIGRPAVYEHDYARFRGELVRARSLRAAYRVTADDPPAVFRAWLAQLDGLALDRVSIQAWLDPSCTYCDVPPGVWLEAQTFGDYDGVGDDARVELWATDEAPILRVEVSRASDDPPRAPSIEDGVRTPPAPTTVVEWTERTAGDVLLTDLEDDIHLPAGTRTLTPTLQLFGLSETLVAAEDGEAAVQALLDEAAAIDEHGEVHGPEITTTDGVEVVEAGFTVPAGGWTFDALAVRAPDDPYATVYLFSDPG